MGRYKIDLGLLESTKNEIQADKDKFREAGNSFTSFMLADSNALSRAITEPLKVSSVTITMGFKLLIDWLNEYIAAVQDTENQAQNKINQIVEDQFDFGIFSNQSASVSNSSISVGALGIGGIIGGSGSTSASSETSSITPTPYDELFEKLKVTQNTSNLEADIVNVENEIKTLEELLEKTTSPEEKEQIKNKLDKLYQKLADVKYEVEILTLINGVQGELKKFSNFEEYKAYVVELKKEINKMYEILNSDKYSVVDILHLILNNEYDQTKPIYAYTDNTGTHFTLEDPSQKITGIKNVEELSFIDISKKYENNELFNEYKQIFNENLADKNAIQAYNDKINGLYNSYNAEKADIITKLSPKLEECNKHQKIVDYIESKIK